MKKLNTLLAGEFRRLTSYKILPVSVAVTLLWVVLFLFVNPQEAKALAPILIYVDVTIMTIVLVGASNQLERQEGTIKSMLVLPIKLNTLLYSKIISSMVFGLESGIIMSLALFIIHGVVINYAVLLIAVLIASIAHAIIGFLLSLFSKDFNSLLGWLMVYTIPFVLPSILLTAGIIGSEFEWILMISPAHSANILIESAVMSSFDTLKLLIAGAYLLILSYALYKSLVFPRFIKNAVRS